MMKWFKEEFFIWVNTVKCEVCGGDTENVGAAQATAEVGGICSFLFASVIPGVPSPSDSGVCTYASTHSAPCGKLVL
jgi:hypothetical protein